MFTGGKADFTSFVPWRSELIFVFAIIAACFYFLWMRNLNELNYIKKEVFFALCGFLYLIFVASIISWFRYGLWFDTFGIVMVLKLLLNIILFILIYTYLKNDPVFYRRLCWALYAPSLILIPFLFFAELTIGFLAKSVVKMEAALPMLVTPEGMPIMFVSWDRFSGFTLNPIHMGYINTIALSFLFVLFLYNYQKKKRVRALIYLLLSSGMCGLNYWSGARSIMIATVLVLLVANLLIGICLRKDPLKVFLYSVATILLLVFVFLLLPSSIKGGGLDRIGSLKAEIFGYVPGSRIEIWSYYIRLIPDNLLGLGLNYEQEFILRDIMGRRINTHSFLLENWAVGGIGAVLVISYILWKAFLKVKHNLGDKNNPLWVYLVGAAVALFGLLVAAIFTGCTFFMQFWILLAMIFGYPAHKKKVRVCPNYELYK